jgi:Protein of unknown function (DUF1592)/Protein of unknown function (DUF1588)/Protein of unknown function (DUF1595)/Protein of unknown function (DUF1585)/Protein of unknown function (DUF1587)
MLRACKPTWPWALGALALCGQLASACYLKSTDPEPRLQVSTEVGPSPLRRLSNSEYRNALIDLFPSVNIDWPPLPDDSEVAGFRNAAEAQEPSDVRVARFETIANAYAARLTADADATQALVGCTYRTPAEASSCAAALVSTLGAKIFRRPLSADELERFQRRFDGWAAAVDFEAAVRLLVASFLQAPQFLYRPELSPSAADEAQPLDPYALATRLSFALWESVPDEALLTAAKDGKLATGAEIRAQAQRLLADAKARRVYWGFHRQWLGLDRILGEEHAYRTPEIDPQWSAQTQQAASKESQLLVENTLANGGTLSDLLLSRRAYVNADLARLYRINPSATLPQPVTPDTFVEVQLPEGERAGILTRIAFLAGLSHRGGNSPPIRGNGISLHLLCQFPASPPPDADLSAPKAREGEGPKTTRTLFEERTAAPKCQGCHQSLNGIGFSFEHYSAAGSYQRTDNGLAVDARGKLVGTAADRAVLDAIDLSVALSESETVYRCGASQWMRYVMGRAPSSEESALVTRLTAAFMKSKGDVQSLLLELVTSNTFRMRAPKGTP